MHKFSILLILCISCASCACMLSCFSRVQLFVTLWTVACQAPLSMRFSRQEYWSWLPCPSPGDLPDPGIEPVSPALAGEFCTTITTWEDTCSLFLFFFSSLNLLLLINVTDFRYILTVSLPFFSLAFAEILFLLLHGYCGFIGLFLEDTWQVDNYRDWHEGNHGNLENTESHHRDNTFGKVSSLSLNLEVSLAQVSHTPDILGSTWNLI